MVLVSGIFISACGDSDTPSVVNPPLESSSSVEDIDPSIESSADATSSESTTSSSAVESSSSMESSSSATTASSSSIGSSSSAIGSVGDYCSTNFRYKYNHDDANKKFTIFEDHPYDECQHLNGNYTFAHIDEVLQHKRSYIFVGDTLVLIQNNEGVYYTLADGSCIPPESLMPSDGTLYKDESYTDTYAILWLYNSIINIKKGDTHNISIYPYDFFLQSGGITVPSEVTISSQSKYAVTFTIGGQEFSATLGENTHRIQYYSGAQYEVDLDLASGSKVCHLHYFSDAKLTSETCKAENAPNFELDTHEETGVEYVDSYNVENIDEFKACLIALAQNH